jgi:hypothetical protein
MAITAEGNIQYPSTSKPKFVATHGGSSLAGDSRPSCPGSSDSHRDLNAGLPVKGSGQIGSNPVGHGKMNYEKWGVHEFTKKHVEWTKKNVGFTK